MITSITPQRYTRSPRGFTIVELLIVIVVIAILAAISIVAYNGIQDRSKGSAAQTLAVSISKKAEIWNSATGSYPSYCQLARNELNATGNGNATGGTSGCTADASPVSGPAEAKLDNVGVLRGWTPVNEKTVEYKKCAAGGAQIIYWYAPAPSGNNNKAVVLGIGGQASSSPTASTSPNGCTM